MGFSLLTDFQRGDALPDVAVQQAGLIAQSPSKGAAPSLSGCKFINKNTDSIWSIPVRQLEKRREKKLSSC